MVPALNALNIACSVYGNHDFDFGLEVLEKLVDGCNFPWLMSNAKYKPTGKALADGLESLVLDWQGRKIALIGLVEWEWMATLATINEEDVEYEECQKP